MAIPALRAGSILIKEYFKARFAALLAKGKHLFPFRTQKLSPPALMVVRINTLVRVGQCRVPCFEITLCQTAPRGLFFAGTNSDFLLG